MDRKVNGIGLVDLHSVINSFNETASSYVTTNTGMAVPLRIRFIGMDKGQVAKILWKASTTA